MGYVGRFAPSPTGLLHAGSVVAALASWLDARAHAGRWLVRIEDVDTPRCSAAAEDGILRQLAALQLLPDEAPLRQSARGHHYENALDSLLQASLAYPCSCTRREIEQQLLAAGRPLTRHADRVYPGTCRQGLQGRAARAWRLRTLDPQGGARVIGWTDRRLGPQSQDVTLEIGDFVLRRADGLWAYQMAVVVDDAAQGVTDVVRGEDLADNTARQILLQRALGVATPRYLHLPLVRAVDGEKLSKQHGAEPVDVSRPLSVLGAAAAHLGLSLPPTVRVDAEASRPTGSFTTTPAGQTTAAVSQALAAWVDEWRARHSA
jgi:glutamyl-Q tRNA(Asp) synthetase